MLFRDFAIIFFSTIGLIHGARSHLALESAVAGLIREEWSDSIGIQKARRQTAKQEQCFSNKLNATFQGNTAGFVSECKSAIALDLEVDVSKPSLVQEKLTPFYRAYCNPECGAAINDALYECGAYNITPPGFETFNIGMCGKNPVGTLCYQLYGEALTTEFTEASCYKTYVADGDCTCQSELLQAVERLDCCLNVIHTLLSGLGPLVYKPSVLYNGCGVDLPVGCNNSPITASGSSHSDSKLSTTSTTEEDVLYSRSSFTIITCFLLLSILVLYCMCVNGSITGLFL